MGAILSSFINVPLRVIRRLSIWYNIRKLKAIKVKKAKQRLIQQLEEKEKLGYVVPRDFDHDLDDGQKGRFDSYLDLLKYLFLRHQLRFLSALMKENTKENDIAKRLCLFWMGVSYTLIYFYVQVYVFEKFQSLTLLLVIVMGIVTIVLPQFSSKAQGFALILIPRSVMILLRGAILSTIGFQIHVVTRHNIEKNYKILTACIKCNIRKTGRFKAKAFTYGFRNSQGEKSFRFTFDNPFKAFLDWIRWYAQSLQNLLQRMKEFILKPIEKVAEWLVWIHSYVPIFSIPKLFIDNVAVPVKDFVVNLMKKIGREIASWFTVRLQSNYHYNWQSSQPNITIKSVIFDSLGEVYEKHSYLQYLISLVNYMVHFYVISVFALIFLPPLYYMYQFRRSREFDNFYITDKLIAYDEEMVAKGGLQSLFPLGLFEQFMYVRRTDPILTIEEMNAAVQSFGVDFALMFYCLMFILFDIMMYSVTAQVGKILSLIYDLLLPEQFPSILQFINRTKASGKNTFLDTETFVLEYRKFRLDIRKCLPSPSQIDWEPYRRLAVFFFLLLLWKYMRPYISRSRGAICAHLFPNTSHSRVVYLYNKIWFQRMIKDAMYTLMNIESNPAATRQYYARRKAMQQIEQERLNKAHGGFHFMDMLLAGANASPLLKCSRCHQAYEREEMLACPNERCLFILCEQCYRIVVNKKDVYCELCGEHLEEMGDEGVEISQVADSSLDEELDF